MKVQRGSIRTLTWIPREPEVFGKPSSPWSVSTSRTTFATWRTSAKPASGVGSRSTRSSSGWSRSARRAGHGLKSITPRLTAQTRCAASLAQSSVALRPLGNRTVAVSSQSGAVFGTRFWKKKSPAAPSTKRFIVVGRSRSCRQAASATAR